LITPADSVAILRPAAQGSVNWDFGCSCPGPARANHPNFEALALGDRILAPSYPQDFSAISLSRTLSIA